MSTKKSIILYKDTLEILDELTFEEAGKLFKSIYQYTCKNGDLELGREMKLLFLPFKKQFIRDEDKYQEQCEKNRENGAKGGRPHNNPKNPSGSKKTQPNPKNPDKDSDRDRDTKRISKLEEFRNWDWSKDEKFKNWGKDTVKNNPEWGSKLTTKYINNQKEAVILHCESSGKTYNDYQSALKGFIRRDLNGK